MKRSARGMGRVFLRPGSAFFWIQYNVSGKRKRESSGSTKRPDAVALLKLRQQEAGAGRPHEDAIKVTLSDLRALIEADYTLQQRRSGKRLAQLWHHVAAHFGDNEPAVKITSARLSAYVTARLEAGAARGTIKNECNALRRAFRLAQRIGTLLANEVPIFPTIKTSDARKGFFEREDHERVRAALPPDEGDVAEFLFWTGWRTSEAKGLQWSDVDEAAGIIRIETTKSGEPRTLPYSVLPALADLIAHRRAVTDTVQRKRGMKVNSVFHRNGAPILHFRRSWATACIDARLGHEVREPDVLDGAGAVVKRGRLVRKVALRVPHDYRRSAARNLSRAGVPEGVIMKLCGWRTRSVFDRYRIVAERDLAEGLAKLAGAPQKWPTSKITRLRAR
jgi:integrase